jgi:hypothetical protein
MALVAIEMEAAKEFRPAKGSREEDADLKARDVLEEGNALLCDGEVGKALNMFKKLPSLASVELQIALIIKQAQCYLQIHCGDKARKAANKVLKMDPENSRLSSEGVQVCYPYSLFHSAKQVLKDSASLN